MKKTNTKDACDLSLNASDSMRPKIRILYVADTASWHNSLWIRFFVKGNICTIFSDKKSDVKSVDLPANLEINEKPPMVDLGNRHLNKMTSLPMYIIQCLSLHRKFKPDVIHAVAIYYGVIAAAISKYTKTPMIYTLQGSEVLVNAKNNILYRWMLRYAIKHAAIVTGDSKTILNAARPFGLNCDQALHIQNGVPLEIFFPLEACKKKNFRENLGIENKFTDVIFSPRALTELYNIDTILESISLLCNQGRNVLCVFTFGFGDERLPGLKLKAYELGIEDNCKWRGFVRHEEMVALYQSSDVVVSIPSSDSSPKSVYEAMACNVPVVVSDLSWVAEYFKPADAVYVCANNSPESIADQISLALKDRDLRNTQKIERAHAIVQDKFSYEANMEYMQLTMRELVAPKHGGTK